MYCSESIDNIIIIIITYKLASKVTQFEPSNLFTSSACCGTTHADDGMKPFEMHACELSTVLEQ